MCWLPIKVHPLTTIITATAGESMPSRNRSADTIPQAEIAELCLGQRAALDHSEICNTRGYSLCWPASALPSANLQQFVATSGGSSEAPALHCHFLAFVSPNPGGGCCVPPPLLPAKCSLTWGELRHQGIALEDPFLGLRLL